MLPVIVISHDWSLRGAVRAELRERNIDALGFEKIDDLARMIAGGTAPSMVILDAAEIGDAATRESLENLAVRVPLLVIDSRTEPGPAVPGAERIYRPVRIGDMVDRVVAIIAEKNR